MFEFTNAEKLRVILASLINIHLDPIGYGDFATIITISILYLFTLIVLLYFVWNRKYPPIQAKGVFLTILMYLSGLTWFIGDLVLNELIPIKGKILSECFTPIVFLRIIFGQLLFTNTLTLRGISLYYIYKKQKLMPFKVKIGLIVYILNSVVVGLILRFAFPSGKFVNFVGTMNACTFQEWFKDAGSCVIWVTWGLAILMCILISNTTVYHNEKTSIYIGCATVFVANLFHTIVFKIKHWYPMNLGWRLAVVYIDSAATLATLWSIVLVAAYNCAFHKDAYLEKWYRRSENIILTSISSSSTCLSELEMCNKEISCTTGKRQIENARV